MSTSMTDRTRVLIVDDHDMLREGLAAFLRAYPDLELVGEAANGVEAVRLCQEVQPEVVLMDLVMPEMDGVMAIRQIHAAFPEIAIISLTSFGEEKMVKAAMQAGATSYLLKNTSATNLAKAIRATHGGLPILSPEIAKLLTSVSVSQAEQETYQLTPREIEVLELLAHGATNDEISIKLHISRNTVKNHVSSILSKLGVRNRMDAMLLAREKNRS